MPYADLNRRREAGRKSNRKYRATHRELVRQRDRERFAANREQEKQRHCDYYAANCEQEKQRKRDYRAANRERLSKQLRERRANDPDFGKRLSRATQKWREAHPEQAAQTLRDWKIANPERWAQILKRSQHTRRARLSEVQIIPFTPEEWVAKVAYWGNRCWVCGGTWSTLDHVKPIAAGGAHALCNLRPACQSCNSSKRHRWPLVDVLGVHRRPPSMAAESVA